MHINRIALESLLTVRMCLLAAMWLLAAAFVAGWAWLVPWADVPALVDALVRDHVVIVGAIGCIGIVAAASIAAALRAAQDMAEPDAGDTHAAFPPPMRTASAQHIERQADTMLAAANRQARQRERLAQKLAREVLPPSYDGTASTTTRRVRAGQPAQH